MKHLHGAVVTPVGTANNNRGETEGNTTTLQKIVLNGEPYTTVSGEALRYATRRGLQQEGLPVNRKFVEDGSHEWSGPFNPEKFVDDDAFGYMHAEGGKEEEIEGKKKKGKGKTEARRSRLEFCRAWSLTPYAGDVMQNFASPGATPGAAKSVGDPTPYSAETHTTRYQYGFSMTPGALKVPARAPNLVDAIMRLHTVGGNHARYLFDFAPEMIVFRWTDDSAPRILNGFRTDENGNVSIPDIIRKIEAGDINPKEVVIGGPVVADIARLKTLGVSVFPGVLAAAEEIKRRMKDGMDSTAPVILIPMPSA